LSTNLFASVPRKIPMKDLHVFIDFETRSLTNLLVTGAWKYAACPSTYPLMLAAYFPASGRALQWLEYKHGRECPTWVHYIAEDDSITVHAHNANFEIGIWRRVLVERWGWPDIPTERWCDTAGKASHANRPRSLAMLAKNLKVKDKDKKGKGLIKLLSMPQKAVKALKHDDGTLRHDSYTWLADNGVEVFEQDPTDGPIWFWNDDPKALKDFAKYNESDVTVEHACDEKLPDYSATEAAVWALDSKINERGIPIDRELCDAACELFEYLYDRCEVEVQTLTNGEIRSPSQAKKVVDWINRRVNFGPSLAKEIVEMWLERFETIPEAERSPNENEVAKMLDIRQIYGGAAAKKYAAALDKIEDDDRARGEFIYHKASTGRWAGSGIQVQNLFRQKIPKEEIFDLVKSADFDAVRDYCDERDIFVGSFVRSCVRGLIQAPEGKTLIVSDFAGIESRVLQWLAGNEEALQLFRDGKDAYVHTAAKMYGLNYDDMMGPNEEGEIKVLPEFKEERQIGKAAVLGLGYQMGAGKFQGELEKNGIREDEAFAKNIVDKWRKANPLIADYNKGLWARVQRAAIMVVKNKKPDLAAKVRTHGAPDRFLRFAWEAESNSLTIQLPSGRKLYYPDATLTEGRFGGDALRYRDGGKMIVDTYGGKLIENIIQAISRDLLVNSAFLAEERPDLIMLIMHVHDELVGEGDEANPQEAFDFLHRCMSTVPDWASGLPLAAETYISKRYTK